MPEPSNNREPTEADLDLVLEGVTGKPVRPADLAAGIASIRQLIAQLESEKAGLLNRLDTAAGDKENALNKGLAAINRTLGAARERLAQYEAQFGAQN